MIKSGIKVVLIHSGKLNSGHYKLITEYKWKIYSISSIQQSTINNLLNQCELLLIDETQRIRNNQLKMIIEYSKLYNIPIIFSYDPKQYLRDGEDRDVKIYLERNYPEIPSNTKKLTTKIRTNKELASFISNLFEIGKSKDNLNYSCVTIDYVEEEVKLQNYME